MSTPPNPLPAKVLAALQAGDRVTAVRLLREATGLGLRESKDAVDSHEAAGMPPAKTGFEPQRQPADPAGDYSPGEVPRSGGRARWAVAAVLAAVLAYFVFRRHG